MRLTTPWQDHLEVPLARVVGIHIGMLDRKETPASFAKRLKTRGSEDLLLAQTKNGEVIAIPGIMEGADDDKLRFRYQDRTRTMPLKQVEGLIMAARPESPQDGRAAPDLHLAARCGRISGQWKDLDSSTWKIESAWGQALKLAGGRDPGRAVRRRQDDLPLRPHSQQGRGDAVLRSSTPLAQGCQPAWASRCG